ncbi:MAG: hypothetical protein Q8784_02265 [Vigna little leaf phytoplasma]|nr:hypothetical protein [Vigna little leaf phytoplasma]
MKRSLDQASHIEVINGVKHHHYIVPDSEFDSNGFIKGKCKEVFVKNEFPPTLVHKFIKKLNPKYDGWICWSPSFNVGTESFFIKINN